MNRRLFLAGLLAALIAAAGISAEARMHSPYRGHRIVPANAAPLDGFTAPSGAYSFRKLRTAYAGPAIRLRRASDNAELDINFLGFVPGLGAPLDVAQANAHCASTTCFLRTIYDQSGNSRHMIQATVGNQLQFLADCGDGRPCTRATLGSGQQLAFVSLASSATFTLSAVARTAVRGTGGCGFAYINNNTLLAHASLDTVILSNASVTINAAATTTAWHAYTGIWAGAASLMRVDATETTGNVAPLTSAISWAMYGGTGATCDEREWVLWDNYILTPAERAALQTNQKNFWGTP